MKISTIIKQIKLKKMKKLILLLIISFVFQVFVKASETQTIRGTVVDKDSKMTIIGATVVLLNSDPLVGTVTDLDGEFHLEKIPLGRQGVKISYVGYNDVFVNSLLLSAGKEIVLEIEMEEKVLDIDEVVIKAYDRKDETINEMAMISARSFTIEETERYAGSLGDPARMVANYAGVMTQNDSRNDIIIRGNTPMGVLWRLDGIDIPNPNHFSALGTTGGPVSMVNNNLLTNSDFLTGAFPAEYGNAFSGVFDLSLRSGNNEKREYVGQIGFNGFELGAEGPISKENKSSYLMNYRYSTLAVFNYLGINMGTGSAVPYYQDLTFKFDFPKTKVGRFTFFGLGGKSNIYLTPDTSSTAYNATFTETKYGADVGVVALSHLIFFNEKTRLKTIISAQGMTNYTDVDSVAPNEDDNTIPYYRSDYIDVKYSVSTQLKSKLNARNNLSFGLIADFYKVNYADSAFIRDIPVYELNTQGIPVLIDEVDKFLTLREANGNLQLFRGFGQYQHKISDKLSFYTGLYGQYFLLNKEFSVEPRIGIQWQFATRQSLNIGYGKHSMMLPRQIYFSQYRDSVTEKYVNSNDYLDFIKSDHFVIGYNNLINRDLRFRVEAYYQHLYNIPISDDLEQYSIINQGDFFSVNAPDSMINEGTGMNYGLELTLEKFLSKGYYFLFTASLFDSKYKAYDGEWRNTAFNGNYVFNLLGGYEFKVKDNNRITLDLKVVWAGGKRYVPYAKEIYDLLEKGDNILPEEKITIEDIEYDDENSYSKRFDDYFRTDLRIGYKVNKKRFNQEWAIDLQNLTGFKSIFTEQYDPESNKLVYAYQQGFYPMFLWRIQF